MATKKAAYNKKGMENLPDSKPAVYYIKNSNDETVYIGSAKKGRVRERILEHKGQVPGSSVQVKQHSSIAEAQAAEARAIARSKPKHNEQGK